MFIINYGTIESMNRNGRPQVGKSKLTILDKGEGQRRLVGFEWGVYFWKKPDGHLLSDGEGRMLSIDSVKGDMLKIAELKAAAAYYGYPEGKPWFYAGIRKTTDEEYQLQLDSLNAGEIPSLNDLGAVYDAKKGIAANGND